MGDKCEAEDGECAGDLGVRKQLLNAFFDPQILSRMFTHVLDEESACVVTAGDSGLSADELAKVINYARLLTAALQVVKCFHVCRIKIWSTGIQGVSDALQLIFNPRFDAPIDQLGHLPSLAGERPLVTTDHRMNDALGGGKTGVAQG